jgi:hypothetical protein
MHRVGAGEHMPDIIFPALDAIPEELRPFAKDVEGGNGVVINLVPNDKLKEFRENNIKVSKERDEYAAFKATVSSIFPEFDPSSVQKELDELRKTAQLVKDGTLKESRDVETEVSERTKSMKEKYEVETNRLTTLTKTAEARAQHLETRLRNQAIKQAVVQAAMDEKSGVHPHAINDIVNRAYGVFQVEGDGERIIPKVGDAVMYGSDGTTAMAVGEWIASLKDTSSHLFRQSTGGGGAGNSGEKVFGGFSAQEVAKMSPEEKIRLGNELTRPRNVH